MAVQALCQEEGGRMKRLAIPLVILVVILIAWIVQSNLEKRRISGRIIDNFLELNVNDINKIVIRTKSDTVAFKKDGGHWYVRDSVPRLADSNSIKNVITTATELKVGNVISQNPERQPDFMVDTLLGNIVSFYNDDKLLSSVVIGKMAQDYAHTYVRKPGSDEVYLAEGMLTYVFNRKSTQWLDKTIFSFSPEALASVEFVYDDRAYKISRSVTDWYVSKRPYKDSILADSMKIKQVIAQVTKLNANDFVNAADSGKIDFDHLSLILNVSLVDGSTHTLDFASVSEETNRVFCRKSGFDETFVVFKSRFGILQKEFKDFLP
jgi:hypothetical protein